MRVALTLLIAAGGAVVARLIGLPLALITGPTLTVTVAAIAGLRTDLPVPLRNAIFLIAGLMIGTGITAEAFAAIRIWPLAFLTLGLMLAATMTFGMAVLAHFFGMEPRTALLCATPGHLTFVMALGEDRNADIATIASVQTIRLLALTLLVPLLARLAGIETRPPVALHTLSPLVTGTLLAIALALWPVCARLQIPAPILMAALLVGGISNSAGLTTGTPPGWLVAMALAGLGALIGGRLSGMSRQNLRQGIAAGLTITALATVAALIGAWLTSLWIGMPLAHLLVAFAPGGLETMLAIGAAMGANPGFTTAAHVLRLLLISAAIPLAMSRL